MIDVKRLLRKGIIVGACMSLSLGMTLSGISPITGGTTIVYAATSEIETNINEILRLKQVYLKEKVTFDAEYSKQTDEYNIKYFEMTIDGHIHQVGMDFEEWLDVNYHELDEWLFDTEDLGWDEVQAIIDETSSTPIDIDKIVSEAEYYESNPEGIYKGNTDTEETPSETIKLDDLTSKDWEDKLKYNREDAEREGLWCGSRELETLSKYTLSELKIPMGYTNTSYIYGSGSRTELFKDYYFIGGLSTWRAQDGIGRFGGGGLVGLDITKVYTKEEICNMGVAVITTYNIMCSTYDTIFCMDLTGNKAKSSKNYDIEQGKLACLYAGINAANTTLETAMVCYSAMFGEVADLEKLLDKDQDGYIEYYKEKYGLTRLACGKLEGFRSLKEVIEGRKSYWEDFLEIYREGKGLSWEESGKEEDINRKWEVGDVQSSNFDKFPTGLGWYATKVSVSESVKGIVKVYKTCAGGSDSVWVKPLKEGTTTLTIKVTMDDGTVATRKTKVTVGKKGSSIYYDTQTNPLSDEYRQYSEYGNAIYTDETIPVGYLQAKEVPKHNSQIAKAAGYYSGVDKYLANGGSQVEAYNMLLSYLRSYKNSIKGTKFVEKYESVDCNTVDFILNNSVNVGGFAYEVWAVIGGEVAKVYENKETGRRETYIYLDDKWRMIDNATLELVEDTNVKFSKVEKSCADLVKAEDVSIDGITYTVNSTKGGYLYTQGIFGDKVYTIKPGKQSITVKLPRDYSEDLPDMRDSNSGHPVNTTSGENLMYEGYAWFVETDSPNRLVGSQRKDMPKNTVDEVKISIPWLEDEGRSQLNKGDKVKMNLINTDLKDWTIKPSHKGIVSVSKDGVITVLKKVPKYFEIMLVNKKDESLVLCYDTVGLNSGNRKIDYTAASGENSMSSEGYNEDIYYKRIMYTQSLVDYFANVKGQPDNYNKFCPDGYYAYGNNREGYSEAEIEKGDSKILKNDTIW